MGLLKTINEEIFNQLVNFSAIAIILLIVKQFLFFSVYSMLTQ